MPHSTRRSLYLLAALSFCLPAFAQAATIDYTRAYDLGPAPHIDDLGEFPDGRRYFVIQQSGEIRTIAVTATGYTLRARITNPLSGDWGHMLTAVPDVNGDGMRDIATYGRDSIVTGYHTFYMLSGGLPSGSVTDGNGAALYTIDFRGTLPRYCSVKPGSGEMLLTEFSDTARRRVVANGAILHTVTGGAIANGGIWLADYNSDGVADYLTGGTSYSGNVTLYLISGADTTDGSAASRAIRSFSDPGTPGLGYAEDCNNIACAFGDINGDGIPEIAVGTRLYRIEAGGLNYGRVVVFDGATAAVRYRLEPDQTHTNGVYFGNNVVSTGDLDHDGVGDLLVSARGYGATPGGFGDGAIIAFSGTDGRELWRHYGHGEGLGDYELTAVDDLNGDSIADLAVGSLSNGSIWLSRVCGEADAPRITAQPHGDVVCGGTAVELRVVAEGNPPPAYQWRKNGVSLAGATTDTLTIPAAAPSDSGAYDVVVRNDCATITSDAATLTVWPTATADVNGDGMVNGLDVAAFVNVLLTAAGGPPSLDFCAADMNRDGRSDDGDTQLFVGALLGG